MTTAADDLAKEHNYGFLQIEEVGALRHIALLHSSDAPVVVNLGAGAGTTAMAMMEAKPGAKITTVDNWTFALDREKTSFEKVGLKPPFQIKDDSAHAGSVWDGGPVDILFIDADHNYESVKKDIAAWMPHLIPGSIVGFHDYDHPNFPGVKLAVQEAFRDDEMILYVKTVRAYRIK